MTVEQAMEKLKSMQQSPNKVVFGYRYIRHKIEDFISISNLRLEVLQIKDGNIKFTSAAPVLDIAHSKGSVAFCDKGVCFITEGARANIILRTKYLKENEEAAPVSFCYSKDIDENSSIEEIKKAAMFNSAAAYPGLDMREPDLYRCSKNPDRFRLNLNQGLVDALGVSKGIKDEAHLKQLFMQNLDALAIKTEEGYVVPFNWIYAGGMVIADAKHMGKLKPSVFYTRTNEFFKNWVTARGWNIDTL